MKKKEIGKSLFVLHNHMTRTLEELKKDSIPRGQSRVLRYIYDHQETTQKDIENEFNLRRSSATEILQKLENIHMIERVSSLDDKRMKKIQITEDGIKAVKQIAKNIQIMEDILHENVSDDDLEIFFKVVDQMTLNFMNVKEDDK